MSGTDVRGTAGGAPARSTGAEPGPELRFSISGAGVAEHAVAPAVVFGIELEERRGVAVRAVLLNVQIRIAVSRRDYDARTHVRLAEVFGTAGAWSAAADSLFWTRAVSSVPAFTGRTTVDLHVPCSFDMEVASSKYLYALAGGEIPLEFLFSGTMFYDGPSRALQVGLVPWDCTARFRLPVATWRAALDRHFPGSAWLRLGRDTYDRLYAWRSSRALPTWEAAIDTLLATDDEEEGRWTKP